MFRFHLTVIWNVMKFRVLTEQKNKDNPNFDYLLIQNKPHRTPNTCIFDKVRCAVRIPLDTRL